MTKPVFGWEEWVALPALGVTALKAKIDTGARTSALHATRIEVFETSEGPHVRFVLHPRPERHDLERACVAPLIAQRAVTASNGVSETRCVIRTPVIVGGLEQEAEVSLTSRETMAFRMLLGRQALRAFGALVDPCRSTLQGGEGAARFPAPRALR